MTVTQGWILIALAAAYVWRQLIRDMREQEFIAHEILRDQQPAPPMKSSSIYDAVIERTRPEWN